MERAEEWKIQLCSNTCSVCSHYEHDGGGFLFLMNRPDLSLLSYHNPFFFLNLPPPPWFLLSCVKSYYDLHNKTKEGATGSGCIAISPLNKCLIQPPSATPKHTHTLLP